MIKAVKIKIGNIIRYPKIINSKKIKTTRLPALTRDSLSKKEEIKKTLEAVDAIKNIGRKESAITLFCLTLIYIGMINIAKMDKT